MKEYYFWKWELIDNEQKALNNLQIILKTYFSENKSFKEIDISGIPIESIISLYSKLPGNLNRNIRCPFPDYNDRTPSFKVYKKTNSFHCFWCNRGWNIVNFVSIIEWISTKEAFKKLINLIK